MLGYLSKRVYPHWPESLFESLDELGEPALQISDDAGLEAVWNSLCPMKYLWALGEGLLEEEDKDYEPLQDVEEGLHEEDDEVSATSQSRSADGKPDSMTAIRKGMAQKTPV